MSQGMRVANMLAERICLNAAIQTGNHIRHLIEPSSVFMISVCVNRRVGPHGSVGILRVFAADAAHASQSRSRASRLERGWRGTVGASSCGSRLRQVLTGFPQSFGNTPPHLLNICDHIYADWVQRNAQYLPMATFRNDRTQHLNIRGT